jgi:hypothetical protein
MNYLTIEEVPEVIKDFYYEQTNSTMVSAAKYDEEGVETSPAVYESYITIHLMSRPEVKSLSDLERLIALGKPKVVLDKFAAMVPLGTLWSWFDLYVTYQADTLAHEEAKAAFEPVTNEDGTVTEFTGVEPTEPLRPIIQTGSDVLAPYLRELFKASRAELVEKLTVTVDDMVFDGNEKAQDRMTRAALVLDDTETTLWVLADNTVVKVTRAQMLMALRLSGKAQSALWV